MELTMLVKIDKGNQDKGGISVAFIIIISLQIVSQVDT